MRLATFNVNGIRAAERRGFASWLASTAPDVVCLQEVRCPVDALPQSIFADYHVAYAAGDRAGRNGVGVMTRTAPAAVRTWDAASVLIAPGGTPEPWLAETGAPLARELRSFAAAGRYLEVDLAGTDVTVASLYLPKGDSPTGEGLRPGVDPNGARLRYEQKMAFLAGFKKQLARSRKAALAAGRQFLVAGDFNIAHTNLDLKNWRTNQKMAGFLPEERAWLDELISARTLVDVTRRLHPDEAGPYSWWSWRGQAFTNDTGWRIDYQLATPALAKQATRAWVDKAPTYDERVSDHAPVVIDYDVA